MVNVPKHDDHIRVVYTGAALPTHGRAKRLGTSRLFFRPDGWTCGFEVEPSELVYEAAASAVVMPASQVAGAERDAAAEFGRMFGGQPYQAGAGRAA